MVFGPPSPDLLPGARNAVGTCLAIRAGERVALIADQASAAVAASLEAALGEHEARTGEEDPNWPDWYAEYMVREQAGDELPT